MSDDDLETAVREFLDRTERALEEYDQGYADADATVSVVRRHVGDLESALE